MANLAASQCSFSVAPIGAAEWFSGGINSKHGVTRRIKIASLAQGGATNKIVPQAVGFDTFYDCGPLLDATNQIVYPAVVDPVNNVILLAGGASSAVGDVTTTVAYITVTGNPAAPGQSSFHG